MFVSQLGGLSFCDKVFPTINWNLSIYTTPSSSWHVGSLIYEMGCVISVFDLLGLCLWLCLAIHSSRTVVSLKTGSVEGTVLINGTASIGKTDEDFICATMDFWPPEKCDYEDCSWGSASLLNLDLSNPILLDAIKAFSPLTIRIGGTLQDKVIYQNIGDQRPCSQFVKSNLEMFGFTQGCLPLPRWDALNIFFKEAGAKVIFGLNALSGRSMNPNGSATGAWDSSNAESLIRYTVNKNYTVRGWELGNELSGNGIGARIAADQYASDVIALHNMVQKVYRGSQIKPLVLGPGGFFDAYWFAEFVNKTPLSLQAITHHIYNLGPGNDNHLIEKILDPSYLDGGSEPFRSLQNILESSGTSTVAWVGEAGGAYNSGHNLVTNAFVFSFWYLDQLGMASSYDTKTYCRQTLIGGNYGLLNTTTFVPNPDYYSALLWHRIMGRNVLNTSFSGTAKIRAYSHCSKQSEGITLLLINLDGNNTVQVRVSVANESTNEVPKLPHKHNTGRTKSERKHQASNVGEVTREEYHLTAKDGNLHSQTVLLNGKMLSVNSSGTIPPLEPVHVNISEPVTVTPCSIVFVHIPSFLVPACR
ncbi:heparanase-like protein 3 isoform X2 [Diospyros lotus]|uniref:heparanase-like protein 3 isoform X2 n=1 Tax=Diospyros lotus TaxID=55363 RepID=UPI002254FBAB|nr:heparanase-like protein 3 isoform X2 [Diospyros lotus]